MQKGACFFFVVSACPCGVLGINERAGEEQGAGVGGRQEKKAKM
jgi:hypothetical protein